MTYTQQVNGLTFFRQVCGVTSTEIHLRSHNANRAPIETEENLIYTNNAVKNASICAVIAAVSYKYIKDMEGLPPQVR